MSDIFDLFKKISKEPEAVGAPDFVVCGLGNPGGEYTFTRHNAGFLAMDYIAERLGVQLKNLKFKALTTVTTYEGHRVLLMKPQTYMNNSGESVRAAAEYYGITPDKIIVISDDVYQQPGRMRIRRSGSDGGQKGLRSIIMQLDSDAFPRIRIGVGAKPEGYDMAAWVLGKIPEEAREPMFSIFGCVYDAVPLIMDGKIDDAMGKFNGVKF